MADVARTRSRVSDVAVEGAVVRRRRRNELRRRSKEAAAAATAAGGDDALPPSEEEYVVGEERSARPEHVGGGGGSVPRPPMPVAEWRNVVPVAGVVAVAGRQRQMEDAVTIWINLCSPPLNRSLPVHYFGVYDGHGGSHFSTICKLKMHEIVKEELMGVAAGQIDPLGRPPPPPGLITDESLLQETWRLLMNRVFARTEMVALCTCSCGSEGFNCSCEHGSLSYSGTTAVAVVLTENHLVVGNCGDSRAVLYRGGRIVPLTFDHKPDRADERTRIEASGGKVVNLDDTARVQGILAMSRAIGDVFLKPYVISEPDVSFTRRSEEDEFVILASDGMWDVIPTKMAGQVVQRCLRDPPPDGGCQVECEVLPTTTATFPCRSAAAASLLTRLAVARSSADNISVVVVDLKGGRRGV